MDVDAAPPEDAEHADRPRPFRHDHEHTHRARTLTVHTHPHWHAAGRGGRDHHPLRRPGVGQGC